MMKKLFVLLTMLPLAALADIARPAWDEIAIPAWDEKVIVPLFDTSNWRFWSVSAAVFIIVVSLTIWIGKRRSISNIIVYVVLEVEIGAAFAVGMYFFGRSIGFEERIIHHPEERPNHHYGSEKIQVKCCECGKEYTTTVTHYGGGTEM